MEEYIPTYNISHDIIIDILDLTSNRLTPLIARKPTPKFSRGVYYLAKSNQMVILDPNASQLMHKEGQS
jgi:hypothetical protein